MNVRISGLFRTDGSATLLIGVITGMLVAYHASSPRLHLLGVFYYWFLPLGLILGPVLASRSIPRFCFALLSSLFYCYFVIHLTLPLNGRDDLPISVWGAPIAIITPFFYEIPLDWQTRALIDFFIFLVYCDVILIVLRRKEKLGLPFVKRFFATICSVFVAVSVSLILFRISWSAFVSGTFCRPLYSDTEFSFSLIVFSFIFPLNPYLVVLIHDGLLNFCSGRFRSNTGPMQTENF